MTDRRRIDRRAASRDCLLSERQVAELAKVSVNTVRYWRQTGILPFVKVGKYPRIWASIFDQVFQKPVPLSSGATGKMPSAGDIRRQL
ncbi:MAG TPA: helix-turn-helix domain-containing protein [bacterium]|nr:helix-turn-helix domain-containing protein [bacterium]